MSYLHARGRVQGTVSKTVGRHDFSSVALVDGGSWSRGGLSGLNRVRGGDPWCSGALSADGRWVRIHTTAPAVGSASKLSAPGALRRTSEVGSSHSLSAYDDSPTIVLERYYSARRKLCNLTKAAATAQPLRRGNTCVDSVAHPTASTSRHVVAPKAIDLQESVGATLRPTAA